MKNWRITSSKTTFEDKWLSVRTDECVREDGRKIAPYHLICYPDWVCVVALTSDLDVLLTREYRHGAGLIGTGLPGGGIEPEDTDAEQAAIRELREETGFRCASWVRLGQAYANWSNHTNTVTFMLGLDAIPDGPQQLDENEEIEVVLKPWKEYTQTIGDTPTQAFHISAVHLAQAHLKKQGLV